MGQHGRRLEIAAQGEQTSIRRQGDRQIQGGRRITAGTAQQHRSSIHQPQQGVIQPPSDRSVVNQKGIGDGAEPFAGFIGIAAQGFTAAVTTGGHQRGSDRLSQQMMQGGSRQHHPQPGAAWRHRIGAVGLHRRRDPSPFEQHDRRRRAAELATLLGIAVHLIAKPIDAIHQQGERLVGPMLAQAQPQDGRSVAGLHEQLKTAHPLQRQDLPLPQNRDRCSQRLLLGAMPASSTEILTSGIHQLQPRPTGWATDRFSMEAPLPGGFELLPAGLAKGKTIHGGVGPGKGLRHGDRVTGTAATAADEGIAMAAISGISQFRQAVGTGGKIRHQGRSDQALTEWQWSAGGDAQLPWWRW